MFSRRRLKSTSPEHLKARAPLAGCRTLAIIENRTGIEICVLGFLRRISGIFNEKRQKIEPISSFVNGDWESPAVC